MRWLTRETVFRQSGPVNYLYTFREYRMKFGIQTQEIFNSFNFYDTDYEQVDKRETDLVGSKETKILMTERDRHLSTPTALS
jgi:hypothetical protein